MKRLSPLLLLLAPLLFGADSDQPIYLEANQAIYYEREERSVYTGKVVVRQGSLTIWADRLEAKIPGGSLSEAVAYGNPMRFQQRPERGKETRGEARKAIYYPERDLVILIGNAIVWQGDNQYRSDRIEYDMKDGIVKAGEATSDTTRVKILLKPKKKEK